MVYSLTITYITSYLLLYGPNELSAVVTFLSDDLASWGVYVRLRTMATLRVRLDCWRYGIHCNRRLSNTSCSAGHGLAFTMAGAPTRLLRST